jgi:serine protease
MIIYLYREIWPCYKFNIFFMKKYKYLAVVLILSFFVNTEVAFALPTELQVEGREGRVSKLEETRASKADQKQDLRDLRNKRFHDNEVIVKRKGDRKSTRVKLQGADTVEDTISRLLQDEGVEYAEPNYIAQALGVPNDPYYPFQWNLRTRFEGGINAERAWNRSTGSGVVVAVIDTGVAYENYYDSQNLTRYYQAPELSNVVFVSGYDFVGKDTHPNDNSGHGTHVAGTIAQNTNNGAGGAGIAYGAKIMPLKVLDRDGFGTYADIADAIVYAADNGAKVINLSLGGVSESSYMKEAVKYAYEKGVVVVAAAGNNGGSILYPAAYDDYVIAVGATRYDRQRANYSSFGPSLDIVAPGGDIGVDQNGDGYGDGIVQQTFIGTDYGNFGYHFWQGTSMASPHVAGVAALVIANGYAKTPADVRQAMESTAYDLGSKGRDNYYGYGLINANAALNWRKPNSEVEVFSASFESNLSPFTQNAQNAWYRSGQRSTDGNYSAEVDGPTPNGLLISPVISLAGKTKVRITFDWLIELIFDKGEYIAFQVSTNGGVNWKQMRKLRGDIDPENQWISETVEIEDAINGTIRFRFSAVVSGEGEDGNVDNIKVVAY